MKKKILSLHLETLSVVYIACPVGRICNRVSVTGTGFRHGFPVSRFPGFLAACASAVAGFASWLLSWFICTFIFWPSRVTADCLRLMADPGRAFRCVVDMYLK